MVISSPLTTDILTFGSMQFGLKQLMHTTLGGFLPYISIKNYKIKRYMNSAKFGFLLLLCLSTLSVLGQKRVTVSITQETDRGTITIDTTFEANGEIDLDEVLDRLEMSGDAREERIVVRSNRGPSRTVVVTQDGAARPHTSQGGKVLLGVYLDWIKL